MDQTYSWTETIDTLDASGAVVTTEIKKHTVSWKDADISAYNAGLVQTAVAEASALGSIPLSLNQKAAIDYEITGAKNAQLTLFPEWFKQAGAAADTGLAKDAVVNAAEMSKAFGASSKGPQYVTAVGAYAVMFDGSMLSMDQTGNVFRDGVIMKGIAAQNICTFHGKIFAKGKTDNKWWQWGGVNWVALDQTLLDPNVFY